MSDNIPVNEQRECADVGFEDETYLLDIFSCVQPAERNGHIETHKQLFLYITRALANNRSAFLQVFRQVSLDDSIQYLRIRLIANVRDTTCKNLHFVKSEEIGSCILGYLLAI